MESPLPPVFNQKFKVELPNVGAGDDAFGGCRSIEHCYERLDQIGEGTYGQVYLARDKQDGSLVALKKIRMDNEKEGFPITAIREIKLLKRLKNENVVNLKEIVRSQTHKVNNNKGSIYMVFEYMDHDLTGLMERRNYKFTVPQIKCYMAQLLKGLHYCHTQNVLHRDLKASNLLIDNQGSLKLADFGLARNAQKNEQQHFTNRVITLWYRPPELILGADVYGPEVDMWSVGCIFAELLVGKPIFPGKDETDQLEKIMAVLGNPTERNMPGCSKLPHWKSIKQGRFKKNLLEEHLNKFAQLPAGAIALLSRLICLDPKARLNAKDAYGHQFFWTPPVACNKEELPKFEASHELQMKRKRHAEREQREAGAQQQQQQDAKRARHGPAPQQHPAPHGHGQAASRGGSGGPSRPAGHHAGPQPVAVQAGRQPGYPPAGPAARAGAGPGPGSYGPTGGRGGYPGGGQGYGPPVAAPPPGYAGGYAGQSRYAPAAPAPYPAGGYSAYPSGPAAGAGYVGPPYGGAPGSRPAGYAAASRPSGPSVPLPAYSSSTANPPWQGQRR
ncbi:hypothetical protein WJX72_008122 [[Myrmecia] bisecta]|uniref:cyclin-dependent kinase n=1 Tax=[Myrmecia] bisecta TaxID=41462 RepID=A0AAW1R7N9_9CHLO